ncbi:MAG: ATP citrate lyase [Nitrospinae bacterium]|nr:ATP citrate lyase [Nitrospinota bacterium]
MSIVANKDTRVVIIGGPAGVNAARRMAEFSYLIRSPFNVLAFVFSPDAGKTAEITYGNQFLSIPIYGTLAEAVKNHNQINTALVYVAADRAFQSAREALNNNGIGLLSMITEGVPEKDAKLLIKEAKKHNKIFNGPSAIGIFSAGECRLGVIGGEYNNLKLSKLYRPGSFGVITKSGGLANEIMWMASQFADGITTAIGIGGDTYPGSDYVTYLNMFEEDPQTKAVILIGEMGGDLEEKAGAWYAEKRRRIKLIATVAGTCHERLPKGMKFGHAGAKEGQRGEGSAKNKIQALTKAGAIVAPTFGALGKVIEGVYKEFLNKGVIRPIKEVDINTLPLLPKKVEEVMKSGEVVVEPLLKTTICDDRGDEPLYAGYPVSELINKGYDIPHIIGLLWNKKLPSIEEAEIIKRIIMLSADHGPCVSSALTTIIAACAGIGLAQAVSAGIIMIGPRFGGAVTDAGRWFRYGAENYKGEIDSFLTYMKVNVGPVPGIGHRVKSMYNPDKRVKELISFVKSLEIPAPVLDFALDVEQRTIEKGPNLILNVDGAMAAILVDLGFPIETLNGFFILARTIGLIGHWIDQKEQGSRLIRLFKYLVNYSCPRKKEVPPLSH